MLARMVKVHGMMAAVLLMAACGLTSSEDDTPVNPARGGSGGGGEAVNGGMTSAGTMKGGTTSGGSSAGSTAQGGAGGGVAGEKQFGSPPSCESVVLRMVPGELEPGTVLCNGPPGRGPVWYHVNHADGGVAYLFPGCSGKTCYGCADLACPTIAYFTAPVPPEGVETTWDGLLWGDDTCGGEVCRAATCASGKEFVAQFCAYPVQVSDGVAGAGGAPDPFYNPCATEVEVEPVCVEVPFAHPSEEPVVGVITP
jgi:hypothetical protein